MPLKEYQVSSYSELQSALEKTQGEGEEIFVFFSCTLDKHGDPTTITCFEAEDTLMEYTEYIRASKRQLNLFYYRVLLEEYSETDSEVKKDRDLRITTVPTLLKWKSYQRLSGLQCCKFPLLSMLFEAECPMKCPVYQPCKFFIPKEKVEVAQAEEEAKPEGGASSELSLKTSSNSKNKKNEPEQPPSPEATAKPAVEEAGGDGQNLKTPSAPKVVPENVKEGETSLKDASSTPKET